MQQRCFTLALKVLIKQYRNNMSGNYSELEKYIEGYWQNLRQVNTLETKTALGLPNPYYVPSIEVVDGFSFPHMFYWDTYFIAQGFWGTEHEEEIVGLAENMFDLIRRLGFVPNSNSFSHLSRSQPPLLSTLAMQIHHRLKPQDMDWLLLAYARVSEEHRTVWMASEQPHNRLLKNGLSRYYDTNVLHVLAEAESGWDYTIRFDDHALAFNPIDLNSFLYKYETDLFKMATKLGRVKDAVIWRHAATRRKRIMNKLMWHEEDGMYYDYDFRSGYQGLVQSLATYAPMFAGMASKKQAARLVENLELFETDYGLTTTDKAGAPPADKQWATPNGWAPLHDIVVDGLMRYGYEDDAKRIAEKWVETVDRGFKETGKIYEKYNVLNPSEEAGGAVYPDQHGFGWTNGVTYKFIQLLKK